MSIQRPSSSYFTKPADPIFGRTPGNRFLFCAFSLCGHSPFLYSAVVVQRNTDATPVSTGCCLAVLVGCMSSSTSILYMVLENPGAVADKWMNLAGWGGNLTVDSVVPNYYLVGISGTFCCLSPPGTQQAAHLLPGKLGACPVFYDGGGPPCHKTFPQNPFILSLLAPDLNGTSPSFQAWELLANDAGMLPLGTQCASLSKASAAMLILSILLTAFTVTLTLAVRRAWLACVLMLDLLDAGLLLAAAVIWTSMITSLNGVSSVPMFNTNAAVSIGPGFWVLWAAVLVKLLVLPRMWWKYIGWPFVVVLFWCSCECLKNANRGLRSWDNRIGQEEVIMIQDIGRMA